MRMSTTTAIMNAVDVTILFASGGSLLENVAAEVCGDVFVRFMLRPSEL